MFGIKVVSGIAVALLGPTALLTSAAAEEVTAPDGVSIEVVTVNGSGCPAGQGAAILSRDRTSFQVTSPAYVAWTGGEAAPTEFRKNCQISVHLAKPQGWTYAVTRVDSTGFANLQPGASGVSRISLYFQGTSPTAAVTSTFTGPRSDTWKTSNVIDVAGLIYAPCDSDRNLNVNTELRVTAGADRSVTSFMVRDPVTTFRLTWKRCG